MIVVILTLVSLAALFLKKQTDEYKKFTDPEPKPTPVADLNTQKPQLQALLEKLNSFDQNLQSNTKAEIKLTPLDLNLAISKFADLENLKSRIYIDQISDKEISGTLHFPLHSTEKLPNFVRSPLGIEARQNNLNGTFTATPLLSDAKLILMLESVTPSKGQIPEEVFTQLRRFLVFDKLEKQIVDNPKQEKPPLHHKLAKLTSTHLEPGHLVITYNPEVTPPSGKAESEAMAGKAVQFVALGAVIFILTMILFFILLSRRKKLQPPPNQ